MGTSYLTSGKLMMVLIWTARICSLSWLAFLTWAMLFSAHDGMPQENLIPWDKAAHFISFYMLSLLLGVGFSRLPLWSTSLAAFGIGLAIETLQPLFDRQFDWIDLIANGLGIAAFTVPMLFGIWKRSINEDVFGILKPHSIF